MRVAAGIIACNGVRAGGQAKRHELNKKHWKNGPIWGLSCNFEGQKSNYRMEPSILTGAID